MRVEYLLIVGAALTLEVALPEPRNSLHPVARLGKLAALVEKMTRLPSASPPAQLLRGAAAWLLVVSAAVLSGSTLLIASRGTVFYYAVGVALVWVSVAPRGLILAGVKIAGLARTGDMRGARHELAGIVGRDTSAMDSERISAAAVESLSENSVDALVGPVFYALLFGPIGALAYRAANTLDSMWGYRSETYNYFGRVAARADDFLNLVPARITVLLVSGCSFYRRRAFRSLLAALKWGRVHPSPNSGYPEAAVAGALGIRLGGPAMYDGRWADREVIGKDHKPAEPDDILSAATLVGVVWGVLTVLTLTGGVIGFLA